MFAIHDGQVETQCNGKGNLGAEQRKQNEHLNHINTIMIARFVLPPIERGPSTGPGPWSQRWGARAWPMSPGTLRRGLMDAQGGLRHSLSLR